MLKRKRQAEEAAAAAPTAAAATAAKPADANPKAKKIQKQEEARDVAR